MKIFISQPMRDRASEEIKQERDNIINDLKKQFNDVEIIDSYFEDAPADARPLWFLGKSFEKLSTADRAYFASGWLGAKGCVLEHSACVSYGIPIIED